MGAAFFPLQVLQMREYRFVLVNVFAESHFGGNPLAVFPQAQGLDDADMQAIARQFNLSETVFAFSATDAAAAVRIFTPAQELPLAGHPVIGCAWVLQQECGLPDDFVLKTRAKTIAICGRNGRLRMGLYGYRQQRCAWPDADVAAMLGVAAADVAEGAYFVDSGSLQLLVSVADRAVLARVKVDVSRLQALYRENPYGVTQDAAVYVWVEEGDSVYVRLFYVQDNMILEDSGTGSACANLGAHFLAAKRFPVNKTVVQGDDMGRPSRLSLHVDDTRQIWVGGRVIPVGEGVFRLP